MFLLKQNKLSVILSVFAVFFTVQVTAQIEKAGLSPRAELVQQIGLAEIELSYGSPSRRDRPVFGGLIPYGKIWRTGANASTKITFNKEVSFGGEKVPAGTYALYSIPEKNKWTVILSKDISLWGSAGYSEKNDLLRIKITATKINDLRETFQIHFDNFHANGGDLIIEWEYTQIRVPIFVDSDALVLAIINEKVVHAKEEVTAASYYDAAQFYYEKEIDLNQAVIWFDKAIELRPEAFWYRYYRAEIAYVLKDYKTAQNVVDECMEMAESAKADYGYIGKCNLLRSKLNKKKK